MITARSELTILEIWHNVLVDCVTEVPDRILSVPEYDRRRIIRLLPTRSSVAESQFWVQDSGISENDNFQPPPSWDSSKPALPGQARGQPDPERDIGRTRHGS